MARRRRCLARNEAVRQGPARTKRGSVGDRRRATARSCLSVGFAAESEIRSAVCDDSLVAGGVHAVDEGDGKSRENLVLPVVSDRRRS
jgi:hypothetical protein